MVAYSQATNGSTQSNTLEKELVRLLFAHEACYRAENLRFNGGNAPVSQYYKGKDDDNNPIIQFQVFFQLAPGYEADKTHPEWFHAIERKSLPFPSAYSEVS